MRKGCPEAVKQCMPHIERFSVSVCGSILKIFKDLKILLSSLPNITASNVINNNSRYTRKSGNEMADNRS